MLQHLPKDATSQALCPSSAADAATLGGARTHYLHPLLGAPAKLVFPTASHTPRTAPAALCSPQLTASYECCSLAPAAVTLRVLPLPQLEFFLASLRAAA